MYKSTAGRPYNLWGQLVVEGHLSFMGTTFAFISEIFKEITLCLWYPEIPKNILPTTKSPFHTYVLFGQETKRY